MRNIDIDRAGYLHHSFIAPFDHLAMPGLQQRSQPAAALEAFLLVHRPSLTPKWQRLLWQHRTQGQAQGDPPGNQGRDLVRIRVKPGCGKLRSRKEVYHFLEAFHFPRLLRLWQPLCKNLFTQKSSEFVVSSSILEKPVKGTDRTSTCCTLRNQKKACPSNSAKMVLAPAGVEKASGALAQHQAIRIAT